jgi:hypothetical protein
VAKHRKECRRSAIRHVVLTNDFGSKVTADILETNSGHLGTRSMVRRHLRPRCEVTLTRCPSRGRHDELECVNATNPAKGGHQDSITFLYPHVAAGRTPGECCTTSLAKSGYNQLAVDGVTAMQKSAAPNHATGPPNVARPIATPQYAAPPAHPPVISAICTFESVFII